MSNWDEFACPGCGVLNFIVFGDKMLVDITCKGYGEVATFECDPWMHRYFLRRIKGAPGDRFDKAIPNIR
ncbi:MAG: hypothetical protein ABR986_03785 [Methanomassiliicoccales archaeon]